MFVRNFLVLLIGGGFFFSLLSWNNLAEAASATRICRTIKSAALRRNIDPDFLVRLLWQESRFNRYAVSPKGARGVAQFMPETAAEYGLTDSFDPIASIQASTKFLRDLKSELGNIGLAAAGYNAGGERIRRWIAGDSSLPKETRDYVKIITGRAVEEWRDKPSLEVDFQLLKSTSFKEACKKLVSRGARIRKPAVYHTASLSPWGAHLMSANSRDQGQRKYKLLQKRYRSVLGSKSPMIVKTEYRLGKRKVRWNIRLGTQTPAEAKQICIKIQLSGGTCRVKKTELKK